MTTFLRRTSERVELALNPAFVSARARDNSGVAAGPSSDRSILFP